MLGLEFLISWVSKISFDRQTRNSHGLTDEQTQRLFEALNHDIMYYGQLECMVFLDTIVIFASDLKATLTDGFFSNAQFS